MNVAETLKKAAELMSREPFCQQILADSIVCGGPEVVFQRILMTAINIVPGPKHYATIERPVVTLEKQRVDLLLYPNENRTVALMAQGPKKVPKYIFYYEACSGFVEIKHIWPDHEHHIGFSDPKKIIHDIKNKLGSVYRHHSKTDKLTGSQPKEFLMVLLNAAYTVGEDRVPPDLSRGEVKCWNELAKQTTNPKAPYVDSKICDVVLLDNVRCQSDPRFRVYAKIIIIDAGKFNLIESQY